MRRYMRSCGDRTLSQPPHLCVCAKGKAKTNIGSPPSVAVPKTLVGTLRCEVDSRYLATLEPSCQALAWASKYQIPRTKYTVLFSTNFTHSNSFAMCALNSLT